MRLRAWLVTLLGVVLLVLGILQVQFDLWGKLTSPECRTTLCCEECRTLSVSRVIDGDTFDSPMGRVRLYGVDAPEQTESCYSPARRRLSRLAGNLVRVEPGPRAADPNGRRLLYVYTRRGESIDELLVREGLAEAWTRDGQHRDLLVELEGQARREGTGCLW